MISVALVDDHVVTRKGIKTILGLHNDISVTLEASNGKELLDQLSTSPLPEIVVLDIHMPVMNGFQTVQVLHSRFPAIKVIIFSLIYEEDTIINMISSGACGYIKKSADPVTFADAIITVHNQGFYLGGLMKSDYFRAYNTAKNRSGFNGRQHITPKEIEFIRLASTNLNYKEIADTMGVRPKTIENYRDSLFQKLDIKNRAALVIYGYKNGLVDIFPH